MKVLTLTSEEQERLRDAWNLIPDADFDKWLRRDVWSLHELAFLLKGKEPVPRYGSEYHKIYKTLPESFREHYGQLRYLASDARKHGFIEPCRITKSAPYMDDGYHPKDLLEWIRPNDREIPEELLLLLESRDPLSEVQTEGDDLDPIEDQNAENDAARADVPLFAGGITWVDLLYDERVRQLQSVDEDATPEPDIPTKGQNKTEQRKGDLYSPGHLQVIVDEINEQVKVRADKNQREWRIYSRADVVGGGSVTWDLLVDFAKCKGSLEGNTQADVKKKNTSGNRINLGNKLMKALELDQSPIVEGRNGVMRFASISLASARRTPDALDRKKIISDDHATADEQATAFLESHGEDIPVD